MEVSTMARKTQSPEEKERRAKIRELLQAANVSSMDDIQALFRDTIAEFMENGLETELEDQLGYGRYDYKSKDTDNSRNGHSSKTLRTSFGDVEVSVPRDRKSEFDPIILKKNQTSKMLYLAMTDITKKWTGRRQDWRQIHAQLAIYFEDRMPD